MADPSETTPERPAEEPLITTATLPYRVGRFLTGTWLRTLHRLSVEGREHLPREGGVLLVSNHQSFLDIPVVAAGARRHVCFVARDTLAESRFLAWIMRESGAVLIRRGTADRQALGEMVRHLEAGDAVCVFPEGTRSRDGSLGEFRQGALFAAKRARVPIVPVGIRGAIEALPRGKSLPSPRRIGIRFGAPIDGSRRDSMEIAREAISGMIGDGRFGKMRSS